MQAGKGAAQFLFDRRVVRGVTRVLLLVILLVAAGVRLHNLEVQSFWYDEGTTYGRSLRTIPELIETMQANIHVPGYFALLTLYEDAAGHTEFALRSFSVWFSLLSVALTYVLGARLYGRVAGIAAASFVALNTFSVYYAQEARMYSLLAAVAALSMYVFVRLMQAMQRPISARVWHQRPLVRWGAALAVVNIVGMYTHYLYPLIMLVQGIMAVLWLIALALDDASPDDASPDDAPARRFGRSLRGLLAYTVANLVTLAAFLPWLPIAIRQITGHGNPALDEAVPQAAFLREFQGVLTFGTTYEVSMGGMGIAVYLLALFGLVMLPASLIGEARAQRQGWRMLLPPLWIALSLVFFMVLELGVRYLRFLTPAQIAVALLLGRGVWVLWHIRPRRPTPITRYIPRFAAVFTTCALLATMAAGLPPLYEDPAYQRDDYRGLARQIEERLRPGDGIIVSGPGVAEIFGYYYDGAAPVYPLPQGDAARTRTDIAEIVDQHDRLFAVYYGTNERDPEGSVEGTLNALAYPISDVWVDDMRLVRYAMPAAFTVTRTAQARFGEAITLEEVALSSEGVQAGDALSLRLTWRTNAPLETRYKVFVQLLNPDGTLAAQRDSEPGGGALLTSLWPVDEAIEDNHALLVPDDLPSGEGYQLIIGLYPIDDPFGRLPVSGADASGTDASGDYLTVAEITVQPPPS